VLQIGARREIGGEKAKKISQRAHGLWEMGGGIENGSYRIFVPFCCLLVHVIVLLSTVFLIAIPLQLERKFFCF
jgi:hypothetical protein